MPVPALAQCHRLKARVMEKSVLNRRRRSPGLAPDLVRVWPQPRWLAHPHRRLVGWARRQWRRSKAGRPGRPPPRRCYRQEERARATWSAAGCRPVRKLLAVLVAVRLRLGLVLVLPRPCRFRAQWWRGPVLAHPGRDRHRGPLVSGRAQPAQPQERHRTLGTAPVMLGPVLAPGLLQIRPKPCRSTPQRRRRWWCRRRWSQAAQPAEGPR